MDISSLAEEALILKCRAFVNILETAHDRMSLVVFTREWATCGEGRALSDELFDLEKRKMMNVILGVFAAKWATILETLAFLDGFRDISINLVAADVLGNVKRASILESGAVIKSNSEVLSNVWMGIRSSRERASVLESWALVCIIQRLNLRVTLRRSRESTSFLESRTLFFQLFEDLVRERSVGVNAIFASIGMVERTSLRLFKTWALLHVLE